MERNRIGAIVVALLCILGLGKPAQAAPLELTFELNPARGAILIQGHINGKPATFLLDTGAARTIVSAASIGVSEMDLQLARFAQDGPGLHGEAVWSQATIRLGSRAWQERKTAAMNLQPLSKIYGRRIDGIIGHDLLSEFSRVTLDFKRSRLQLED